MFVGTHACLPLVIAGISDWQRVNAEKPPRFTRSQLYFIAFCGILPDLLSLHISLEARHHSPSHTAWFTLVIIPVLLLFGLASRGKYLHVALMAWIAIALHLFCDMISGGIPLWGVNTGIVGKYYVPPFFWWPLDCVMILSAWFVFFRTRYLLSKGTMRSPTCSWEEQILDHWRKKDSPKDRPEAVREDDAQKGD